MKHIILNIILVFFFMIHHNTADENAQIGENYKLEDSTLLGPLREDLPNVRNDESSFHDRLKNLPYKVAMQLVSNGQEIGKGVEKSFEGKYLEGAIQTFGGITGLFKDSLANTRHLIFGAN